MSISHCLPLWLWLSMPELVSEVWGVQWASSGQALAPTWECPPSLGLGTKKSFYSCCNSLQDFQVGHMTHFIGKSFVHFSVKKSCLFCEYVWKHVNAVTTACLLLTGLRCLGLCVPCDLVIAQLFLQLAAWAQNLPLWFPESDVMTEKVFFMLFYLI